MYCRLMEESFKGLLLLQRKAASWIVLASGWSVHDDGRIPRFVDHTFNTASAKVVGEDAEDDHTDDCTS